MEITLEELANYPLPAFLEGRCSHTKYIKWLNAKANTLQKLDRRRNKPFAFTKFQSEYKKAIHKAVIRGGEHDPYTGEALAWDRISEWDSSIKHPVSYKKRFHKIPTVDHSNPNAFKFEICSWQINEAKSDKTPKEFVELCRTVATYRQRG
jgi:hypothetical protein